jgi:hypothetical protein
MYRVGMKYIAVKVFTSKRKRDREDEKERKEDILYSSFGPDR